MRILPFRDITRCHPKQIQLLEHQLHRQLQVCSGNLLRTLQCLEMLKLGLLNRTTRQMIPMELGNR